jgi:threonine synthase
MILYSTRNREEKADFRTAVMRGLAPDGGLYMPDSLPKMPVSFWQELRERSLRGKARILFDLLLADDFSENEREEIASRAFSFDAPVVSLDERTHVLELFHGPTLAFKDFGARSMAAMMSVFARKEGDTITIVTATSGDTGAAVAQGFHNAPGVEVYVLYPSGQVSPLQEKQFTTLGGNITALEVNGTFDDCQRLVKDCFADKRIREARQLTTANSINIARLLPQMIYYIHAVAGLLPDGKNVSAEGGLARPVVCSVPSGNFGNLTAGLLAHRIGLPVRRFIAATNVNHVVPDYLSAGSFHPKPSLRTISNAMDVGNPSNFDRMLDLYGHDHQAMSRDIQGAWFDDPQTREAITDVWNRYGYLMDPHTAVGYLGSRQHTAENEQSLILATAHPAKFPETITSLLPDVLETPDQLLEAAAGRKQSIPVEADLDAVRDVLLKN